MIHDPYLRDMLSSLRSWCRKTESIASAQELEGFLADEIRQLALAKAVEQVGELAGRLLDRWPEFAQANPHLRLVDAYAMRNRLAHGYDRVELKILYLTARESVPELGRQLDDLTGEANDRP